MTVIYFNSCRSPSLRKGFFFAFMGSISLAGLHSAVLPAVAFPLFIFVPVIAHTAQVIPVEVKTVIIALPVQETLLAAVIEFTIRCLAHHESRRRPNNQRYGGIITGRGGFVIYPALFGSPFFCGPDTAGFTPREYETGGRQGKERENKCPFHEYGFKGE